MDEWAGFSETIKAKSDQINAADLFGSTMTITITKGRVNLSEKQSVTLWFEGSDKVYRPCLGMRRGLALLWGGAGPHWVGRSLTLFRDPDVPYGGVDVGGIRIEAATHIDRPQRIVVPVSRGKVKEYLIKVLKMPSIGTDTTPAIDPVAAMEAATKAASGGKAAFTFWWNGDGRSMRDAVKPHMAGLSAIAANADAENAPPEDDTPPM